MKTHKKRHTGTGWSAAVTMADGRVFVVELRRGNLRQYYFGNPSFYWNASVYDDSRGTEYRFLARRGDSAKQLVRRALRIEAEK